MMFNIILLRKRLRLVFAFGLMAINFVFVVICGNTAETGVTPSLIVPKNVYIAVGRELNLWHDTLWPLGDVEARISVKAEIGSELDRRWSITPAAEHVGKIYPVTVEARSPQGSLLDSISFKLHVVPNNNGTGAKQLLFVGDSLTAFGVISAEFKRLTEADGGFTPVLLGSQGDGVNRHEGRGGWAFRSYAQAIRSFYCFVVSGIDHLPSIGFGYRHNNIMYRVRERRLFTNADGKYEGTLLCNSRQKDNPQEVGQPKPDAAGVLEIADRIKGLKGDAKIVFSHSAFPVPGNPFWDDALNGGKGGLDFQKYMQEYRCFGAEPRIDFAFIQLGVNDSGGVLLKPEPHQAKALDEILESSKILVRGLLDPAHGYPDCKIIIALTPSGCNTPQAYKYKEGMAGYERQVRLLWRRLLQTFDENPEFSQVRVAINGLMIDRDNGYPKGPADKSSDAKIVHNNAVHPNEIGYRQCADGYYSVLRGWLEEKR